MGAVSWEVLAFRVGIDRVKGDVAFPLFVPRNVGATSTLEVKIFASAVVDAKLQNDSRSAYFFCSIDVQREAWGTHKRIWERAMQLAMRSSLWPWLHCTTAYPRANDHFRLSQLNTEKGKISLYYVITVAVGTHCHR